jgi:hypothetical protein
MTCQNNACRCNFLHSTSTVCKEDSDCDCKLNWKLLMVAVAGSLVGLALLAWGITEETRANREGAELARLIRKAARAA